MTKTKDINPIELECQLLDPDKYSDFEIPKECLMWFKLAQQSGSAGIGHDSQLGWFILVTAGQGPILYWKEGMSKLSWDSVHVSKFQHLNSTEIKALKQPLIIIDKQEKPIAVIIPYALYLQLQEACSIKNPFA